MQNGGILELMMRYLKVVGQKFLEEWPAGLSTVVLDLFNCWRKHSAGLPNPLLRDSSNQHIKQEIIWHTYCLHLPGNKTLFIMPPEPSVFLPVGLLKIRQRPITY
ncbi:calcineurin-binding protein cabin-1-like [Sinocyclocheilus rhinocerous]|uniref:calcineurin-binding protein cabin-1-like n=1 Tax=Sinocyclocheilus rhinocerous TaxID=307959 RepID=UPI0007B7F25D|nr:PREDICTED: calcineurin-binding protein cabin-1-like [Sinocyclocheilus rhinocerous]